MLLVEIAGREDIGNDPHRETALAHNLISSLRSPLAAVRLGADLLSRHDLSPAQSQRLARNVLASATRIEEILSDFASKLDMVSPVRTPSQSQKDSGSSRACACPAVRVDD